MDVSRFGKKFSVSTERAAQIYTKVNNDSTTIHHRLMQFYLFYCTILFEKCDQKSPSSKKKKLSGPRLKIRKQMISKSCIMQFTFYKKLQVYRTLSFKIWKSQIKKQNPRFLTASFLYKNDTFSFCKKCYKNKSVVQFLFLFGGKTKKVCD